VKNISFWIRLGNTPSSIWLKFLGFCLMGNTSTFWLRCFPNTSLLMKTSKKRHVAFYGDDRAFSYGQVPFLREKLSNLILQIRESSAPKNLFP